MISVRHDDANIDITHAHTVAHEWPGFARNGDPRADVTRTATQFSYDAIAPREGDADHPCLPPLMPQA